MSYSQTTPTGTQATVGTPTHERRHTMVSVLTAGGGGALTPTTAWRELEDGHGAPGQNPETGSHLGLGREAQLLMGVRGVMEYSGTREKGWLTSVNTIKTSLLSSGSFYIVLIPPQVKHSWG